MSHVGFNTDKNYKTIKEKCESQVRSSVQDLNLQSGIKTSNDDDILKVAVDQTILNDHMDKCLVTTGSLPTNSMSFNPVMPISKPIQSKFFFEKTSSGLIFFV